MPELDLVFRPATLSDVPRIMVLVERSVRALQRGDYSPAQIDASIGSAFGVDKQLIEDQTYFIAALASDADRWVACGGWSFRKTMCGSDAMDACASPRNAERLDPACDFAKIRAIFVDPDFARQGIGSRILAYCEDAAAAAGFTRFEMGSTVTGVRLYALRGYEERERIALPLPGADPIEVIVMSKTR